MSMSFTEPTRPSATAATDLAARREFYATALSRYVRRRREELGMTVEYAAKQAGMATSEWLVLESGWAPTYRELRPIAEVLEVGVSQLTFLSLVSRCHQQAAAADLS